MAEVMSLLSFRAVLAKYKVEVMSIMIEDSLGKIKYSMEPTNAAS
jgi:hypothetical protein